MIIRGTSRESRLVRGGREISRPRAIETVPDRVRNRQGRLAADNDVFVDLAARPALQPLAQLEQCLFGRRQCLGKRRHFVVFPQ